MSVFSNYSKTNTLIISLIIFYKFEPIEAKIERKILVFYFELFEVSVTWIKNVFSDKEGFRDDTRFALILFYTYFVLNCFFR